MRSRGSFTQLGKAKIDLTALEWGVRGVGFASTLRVGRWYRLNIWTGSRLLPQALAPEQRDRL